MEEHERENDIGWRGYSVLFPNIWKFLALENLPCHENTDSCHIWVICPKWPICLEKYFFRKPTHTTCYFHSYLSTFQKNSDVNPLIKYTLLKNTEILLARNILNVHATLGPFPCGIFFKKPIVQIQSYEDAPFSGLKWPICPNKFFQKAH